MATSNLVVLGVAAWLLVKHFVFDFVLQSRDMLSNKGRYGHPAGLGHAAAHIAGSAPAILFVSPTLLGFCVLFAEGIAHYHIDWGRERILSRAGWSMDARRWWALLGVDQVAHGLTYIAMAGVIFR